MFGRKHYQKRSPNILFVIFRLLLSVVMFSVLLVSAYSAYKHFSGLDPLKLNPQAVVSELLAGKVPKQFTDLLSASQQSSQGIPSAESIASGDIPVADGVNANLVFRFLIVADSHNDNANLAKVIDRAKDSYPDLKFIIGLGDYTEVGTITELEETKKQLDSSGLRYFLIPGDHDLWDCRNRNLLPAVCFSQVFGPNYQTFTFENFKFLLLDNSDNYTGFDTGQLKWITDELDKSKQEGVRGILVFLHEPLYHPSSDHIMGWVTKELKIQAGGLVFQLKAAGVTQVFTGDIHYFSQYLEPKTGIAMTTIGAVTSEKNPQAPRFAVVSAFEDGRIKVEDREIK